MGGDDIERDTWNIRVHKHIKEYYQKNHISPRQILEEKYYELKDKELPELLKELAKAKTYVAQLEVNVAQLHSDCDTKEHVCGTILDEFKKQGRDIDNITSRDRFLD